MTLNCNGKLLDLSSPKVMGILNVTKDSFFDGGKYHSENEILHKVEQLLTEGASIIDIGLVSTRPGATDVPFEEEKNEAVRVLKIIRQKFPDCILSIDTQNSQIAKISFNEGVDLINDISGGDFDEEMFECVRELKIPYILTHTQGRPQTMQLNPTYADVGLDIIKKIKLKIFELEKLGFYDIVVDPGFGFGKTIEQNYQLLNDLGSFRILGKPILVGLSRKSMIWKILKIDADQALNGTCALHTFALLKGANILRVHDVKEAIEVIQLVEMLNGENL